MTRSATSDAASDPEAGVVVIGRNEGQRFQICLKSLVAQATRIVYVDSGSTDGSVAFAVGHGVDVVELDMRQAFTMARGRNAGFQRLTELYPDTKYVQFVDGDCELLESWMARAQAELQEHSDIAIVCGQRCERYPDASVYNRLCDMEWNASPGEARACGGDFMIRVEAFKSVNGFNAAMIAGEEPELCVRLRHRGWKILQLADDMTLHDVAMMRFRQFWRRGVRCGHAYAEGAWLQGQKPERHNVRPLCSAVFWGLLLPITVILAVIVGTVWSGAGFVVAGMLATGYLVLWSRIYRSRRATGDSKRHSCLYGVFVIVQKSAEAVGILLFGMNLLRGKRSELIEYKSAA